MAESVISENPHNVSEAQDSTTESLIEWELQEKRREEELIQFINDFLTSDEFADIIHKKKHKRKKDASTMVTSDINLNVFKEEQKEEYALTKAARKIYQFERYFERYVKRKMHREVVTKQDAAIKTIRVSPVF